MVIFSFVCSLIFCLVLITFIFGLIVSLVKSKKIDNELNDKINGLNSLFNSNIGGDIIDENKKE